MKTFHVTVNVRAGYGDPAKEAFVGIYQTDNSDGFRKALEWITNSKKRNILKDDVSHVREELREFGYLPLPSETLFVPIG
jgi:hypothetical protein